MISKRLNDVLQALGMDIAGWFEMANGPDELAEKSAVLIGNHGTSMWSAFTNSGFASDGLKNPLDRWTKDNLNSIAAKLNATALYPFLDGRLQHWPFQKWAKAAINLQQSPQGLLIDPEFGLWHAFRAVLVFEEPLEFSQPVEIVHPCDGCFEKPCLNTCPVGAISSDGFDAPACIAHVKSNEGTLCRTNGCIARNSCPVGAEYTYSSQQQAFHMRAFIGG